MLNNKEKAIVYYLINEESEDIKTAIKEVKELSIKDYSYIDILGVTISCYDDNEADQAWSDSIDNYIDECILPDLPDNIQNYFDYDKFKHDCSFDGRGHSLSSYDGCEHEYNINDEWIYIYKN